MNTTVLFTLLIAAAMALPAWLAWRKAQHRSTLSGWLASLLLGLPFALTLLLHPEWLSHPVPDSVKYWVLDPLFLGLCALAGGLVYRLAPLALALLLVIGKAFGEAFKDVEWRQDEEDDNKTTYSKLTDPFDWYNDWNYSFYRESTWDYEDDD
jgi:hypothetical protein